MNKFLPALFLVFAFVGINHAQAQPTLDETLKWIKEKYEDPIEGAQKRQWKIVPSGWDREHGVQTIGEVKVDKNTFEWKDTEITVKWSGTCIYKNKDLENQNLEVVGSLVFRLEDLSFEGQKPRSWESLSGLDINGGNLETGGIKNAYAMSLVTEKNLRKIKIDNIKFEYSQEKRNWYIGIVNESALINEDFIYFNNESIRDRAIKAFIYAIELAKKKYPQKEEIF